MNSNNDRIIICWFKSALRCDYRVSIEKMATMKALYPTHYRQAHSELKEKLYEKKIQNEK